MKKIFVLLLLVFFLPGGCSESSLQEEGSCDVSAAGSVRVKGQRETSEEGQCQEEDGNREDGSGAAQEECEQSGETEEVPEETEEAQEEAGFLCDSAFEYAALSLNEAELLWYHDMEQALGNFCGKVKLNNGGLAAGCDEEDIDRIFQCVLNDHPELFYVEGYSYTKYTRGDRITTIEFSGTYSVDRETAEERRNEIENAVAEFLSGLDENADQYTKVKYVYDTIIRETDYDLTAPDNQNIYSVFVNHRSVCQGYAKATQYLLNRLGVDCTLVLGAVETEEGPEGHAWNLVNVEGSYYYVDATWGDASYNLVGEENEASVEIPEINYDYLNVTTEEILKTHSLKGDIPMPQCIATEANYYSKEGALFTSYDREQMQALFDRAKEEGREGVTIKCANQECYFETLTELVDNQEVFRYLGEGDSSVAYAQNDNQMSLTFWVTNE